MIKSKTETHLIRVSTRMWDYVISVIFLKILPKKIKCFSHRVLTNYENNEDCENSWILSVNHKNYRKKKPSRFLSTGYESDGNKISIIRNEMLKICFENQEIFNEKIKTSLNCSFNDSSSTTELVWL